MRAPEDPGSVVTAHERRLATLDPLLPRAHPLPEAQPGETVLTAAGARGIARRKRPDPDSIDATWGGADRHFLLARVGGPEPVAAMTALLAHWRDRVAAQATPGDADSEATLTWPSRDVAMTRLFLARGLVPSRVIAARAAGRPVSGASGTAMRLLGPGDVDGAVALWLEAMRWDAHFGSATERPSTADAFRRDLLGVLDRGAQWTWVAETGRQLRGLLMISPPDQSGWIAPNVSGSPAAYLGCLAVTAGHRGNGVGAALVQHGHLALDAAGVGVALLHYAALNPLSGPFWHRQGYRPLWTMWSARPASRLQPADCD